PDPGKSPLVTSITPRTALPSQVAGVLQVQPLPPLASVPPADACRDGTAADCWSLAPWRGRTVSPQPATPSATPSWAFAPPAVQPAPAAQPAQTGCWAFSLFSRCARTD